MTNPQEVWLQAYCATLVGRPLSTPETTSTWASAAGDFAMTAFQEKFYENKMAKLPTEDRRESLRASRVAGLRTGITSEDGDEK